MTDYGIEDEIIGVLEIPVMELTMPIYLGASDAHLAVGAAVLGGICPRGEDIKVHLRGGILAVRCEADGTLYMTGDATEVFRGTVMV